MHTFWFFLVWAPDDAMFGSVGIPPHCEPFHAAMVLLDWSQTHTGPMTYTVGATASLVEYGLRRLHLFLAKHRSSAVFGAGSHTLCSSLFAVLDTARFRQVLRLHTHLDDPYHMGRVYDPEVRHTREKCGEHEKAMSEASLSLLAPDEPTPVLT